MGDTKNAEISHSELSRLGKIAADSTHLSSIWEILRDSWDPKTNPNGYINLGVAENALMHGELSEYISERLTCTKYDLTYGEGPSGSAKIRCAIARFLNRQLKPMTPLEQDHLVVTNGCSSAIEHCAFLLTNPGEVWLVGQPYYHSFKADLDFRPQTEMVGVTFGDNDPVGPDAAKAYATAIDQCQTKGKRVKGLLLCHPHNPLGRCYPRDTIIEIMKLCQKHRIHFLSDEIYALSVWHNREDETPPPIAFESALSIDPTGIIDRHLVHVLWGMSKDFGANGLRIGVVISQGNPDFVKAVEMASLYSYSSNIVDSVVTRLLEDDEFTDRYINSNQQKLADTYSSAVAFMRKNSIEYAPGANAAFFMWLNLGRAYADRHKGVIVDDVLSETIMKRLLNKKVFCTLGRVAGGEQPGWFRIVFARPEEEMREGLVRIVASLVEE